MKLSTILTVMAWSIMMTSCSSKSWRDASRESVGITPKASEITDDIYQVYYARAYSWKGAFGVHPWVAWKLKEESEFTVAQVTSWNIRRNGSAISVVNDLPDRMWFDHMPYLLVEIHGDKAKKAIEKTKTLIAKYPYKAKYKVWPGPNSNTFVAYLLRNIDELKIELPPHAIGKDYLEDGKILTNTASNTGFKFSLYGLLGAQAGIGEGVEINLMGLNFGVDLFTPAIKLPIIGRLGLPDEPIR